MSDSSKTRDLTAIIRAEQREGWLAGTPVPAEEYLKRYPVIAADPEAAIDLIHNEFLLAERFGPLPIAEDFLRRFPAYAETLRLQFDLHRAVAGSPARADDAAPPTQAIQYGLDANGERPRHFARYKLLGTLGQGGMGCVYLAYDEQLDRKVALKVPKFASGDREHAERFLREARIAAGFRHQHICPVYDVSCENDSYYLTMPVIEGQSLAERLKSEGPMSSQDAADFLAKVARAVGAAHAAGVVHRDLKPGNIMLDPAGEPVVMDFGLARRGTVGESVLTSSGLFLGTPSYAAPEQITGSPPTSGMDVYALGSILFECLTGRPPFVGRGDAVMRDKLATDPEPPSRFAPTVHPGLSQVCLKAIGRDPKTRFESTDAFAIALENYRAFPRRGHTRRRALQVAGIGLVLLLIGLGLCAVVKKGGKPLEEIQGDPIPVGSRWIGKHSFLPDVAGTWDPAGLVITQRDGDSFRGECDTMNGDYVWEVEGTLNEGAIRWKYVAVIRELTPTKSVQNGAFAEGRCDGKTIEVEYIDPGDDAHAPIRLTRME